MKPEMILQSNLLDILFDDRNKAYGAYILRSDYNSRLKKAMTVTVAVVLLFSLLWYVKANYFTAVVTKPFDPTGPTVILQKIEQSDHLDHKELQKQQHKTAATNQVSNAPIRIVPDDSVDKKVPDQKSMENAQIGLVNVVGKGDTDYYPAQGGFGVDSGTVKGKEEVAIQEPVFPYERAEFMPEFPGGNDGLLKFMLRNLAEPDDMEEGERIVVQARFVVEADGQIDNIEITNPTGRYNNEVIRVLKKMPLWKPGMQNGVKVPVYMMMPVTFQKE